MIQCQGKFNQDLEDILLQLLEGWQRILGSLLLGAYLGGSFAHGGWDKDSDVDFNVVINRDLHPSELSEVIVCHSKVYNFNSYWAKHLEGSFFPRDVLADFSKVEQPLWYLDNGSLEFHRSTHDNTLVNCWVLRKHGVILDGPEPKTWIPSIPEEMLKAEVRNTMQSWGGEILMGEYPLNNRWAQTFAVLSFCRMAQTMATGKVQSKFAGADWAKQHLSSSWQALIEDALTARENQYKKVFLPSNVDRVNQTKAFIQHILNNLK